MRKMYNIINKINVKVDILFIEARILYIRMQLRLVKFIRTTELLPMGYKLKLLNSKWLKKENTDTKIENI